MPASADLATWKKRYLFTMPFNIFGSRSNTPNESIQQSNSNTAAGYTGQGARTGSIDQDLVAEITRVMRSGGNIKIVHCYRHFTANPGLLSSHHSQLFVMDAADEILFNFGLWTNDDGKVVFGMDERFEFYKPSSSYSPNPVVVSTTTFLTAFLATRRKCGPDYKLLHNNCQKFARLLMEELGSTHKRRFFFL